MQTLGLSDSTPRSESRLKSLFWPSIQSGADVDYLAVQGFWVCTIVGVMSFASLAIFANQPITGLMVFLLFHFGGIGVRDHNPFAAAIMLVYYLVDFLVTLIIAFIVLATFIQGGRPPQSGATWYGALASGVGIGLFTNSELLTRLRR